MLLCRRTVETTRRRRFGRKAIVIRRVIVTLRLCSSSGVGPDEPPALVVHPVAGAVLPAALAVERHLRESSFRLHSRRQREEQLIAGVRLRTARPIAVRIVERVRKRLTIARRQAYNRVSGARG